MSVRRRLAAGTLILSLAAMVDTRPAAAHPHVFIDTALRLVAGDDGRATAVEVTWIYDDLYSLLVLEDMGLDDDADGVLTEAEREQLAGFDMNWVEGYDGDLHVAGPEGPLKLGPPQPLDTRVEEGRILTRHLRPLPQDTPRQFQLRVYDPSFYTAYDLTGGIEVPPGCGIEIERADLDAAYARVERELDGRAPTIDDYPAVGDAFADTVRVSCGAGG